MFSIEDFQRKRQGHFGETLFYFEEIESTNFTAEQFAREGAAEGVVVLGNEQTIGRGRKGNAWFSPPDVNLYFSLILRPDSSFLRFLPYVISLGLQQALFRIGVPVDLKWPNDLLAGDRKICGILIQTASENQNLQFAIVGCGINVNVSLFPDVIADTATSVFLQTGRAESRESLLASCLLETERLYGKIESWNWEEFCNELETHSTYLRGCPVRIDQDGSILEGISNGLDAYGGLKVDTSRGSTVVYAGEVQSCRKKTQP